MKLFFLLPLRAAFLLGLATAASATIETYEIDPVHSSVGFGIRHIFTRIPGSFTQFSGTITIDRDDLQKSSVQTVIETGSVNTANEKRDAHLKSADFFEVARYPTITFKSKSWKKTGDDSYAITGDLTIKDVTREVVLKSKVLGFGPGMMPGTQVTGWEATTQINRRDFGVNGPAMLGKTVGDEVEISIAVEAGLKK